MTTTVQATSLATLLRRCVSYPSVFGHTLRIDWLWHGNMARIVVTPHNIAGFEDMSLCCFGSRQVASLFDYITQLAWWFSSVRSNGLTPMLIGCGKQQELLPLLMRLAAMHGLFGRKCTFPSQCWYAKPRELNLGHTRPCARNLTNINKATSLYQREVTLSCDNMCLSHSWLEREGSDLSSKFGTCEAEAHRFLSATFRERNAPP